MKKIIAVLVLSLTALPTSVQAAPNQPTIVVDDGVFGDVTIAVVTNTDLPFAHAVCEQNGVVVYEEFVSVEYGSVFGGLAVFQLGPTALWSGGDAECIGDVGYLRQHGKILWKQVASDDFHVEG